MPRVATRYLPAGLSVQPIDRLHVFIDNPRDIQTEDFARLKESIRIDASFLWERPLLVSDGPQYKMRGFIYAGNHRAAALRELYDEGWESEAFPRGTCPVDVDDVDPDTCMERLYRDNNEWAQWETQGLAASVKRLQEAGSNVYALGFKTDEVDALLQSTDRMSSSLHQAMGTEFGDGPSIESGNPEGNDLPERRSSSDMRSNGIHKLELAYDTDDYASVTDHLLWARTRYAVETNAEAVQELLDEFVRELG